MKRKKLKDATFGKRKENKSKPSIGFYFKSAFFLHAIINILIILLFIKISVVCTNTKIFLNKGKRYYYNKKVVVEFSCLSLCLFESLDWSFLHITHTGFPNNSIQCSAENDWEVTQTAMPYYADNISRAALGVEQTRWFVWMHLSCPVASMHSTGTLHTETSLTW